MHKVKEKIEEFREMIQGSRNAFLTSLKETPLTMTPKKLKISWTTTNPYNKRWQFKFKHAFYSYPKEPEHPTYVKKPEDSWNVVPIYWSWIQDAMFRWIPNAKMWYDRRTRMYDNFTLYFLPATSLFLHQFAHINFGFHYLSLMPWVLIYIRLRDKTLDPDFKETYLRDMIYQNPEITKLFKEETIHVLDYDCEYDAGIPDAAKFPEFQNKIWQFFNSDTSMTTGHFVFGDVESGATMNLKFKTMPCPGKFRFQVGEPFYFYDLRAEITHNGAFKEVVLVDEKESLK